MKVSLFLSIVFLLAGTTAGQPLPDAKASISTIDIPRLFVMNEGQWDERITASSMGLGPTVSFGREGYSVGIERGASLQTGDAAASVWPGLRLIAPSPRCAVVPRDETGPKAKYHMEVEERFVPYELTQYSGIAFEQAWPGIEVHVSRDASGMRHDIDVKAGSDLSDVRLRFDNAEAAQLVLSGTEGIPGLKPKLEAVNGGVEVTLGDAKVLRDFRVTLVYNYYWGGSEIDNQYSMLIDRSGNLSLIGATLSRDFPLLPPSAPAGTLSDLYILKVAGDGSAVIRSATYQVLLFTNGRLTAALGKHDNLIVHMQARSVQGFITPDAEFPPVAWPHPTIIVVFDSSGTIRYGSAVPNHGRMDEFFHAMTTDSDGTLYAVSSVRATPSFTTPDALIPAHQGGVDGLVMKFHPDTYRLTYASCIGGPNDEMFTSIAVDGCGSVALAGYSRQDGFPSVHATQPTRAGSSDLVFARISSDGGSLLFATYLGGSDDEFTFFDDVTWTGARTLRFDAAGNLYFVATTTSGNFPLVNGFQHQGSGTDVVVGKFSPYGTLLFTSRLGGGSGKGHGATIDVDGCGNLVLTAWTDGASFPKRNPILASGQNMLFVIDTRTPELLFSSPLGTTQFYQYGGHFLPWGIGAVIDGTTVYYGGHASKWYPTLPATPGFPAGNDNTYPDIQISRFEMPDLCSRLLYDDVTDRYGKLAATVVSIDTLYIDSVRGTYLPNPLAFCSKVRNVSGTLPSDSLRIRLRIPSGLRLHASSRPANVVLPPLAPFDSVTICWALIPLPDSLPVAGSIQCNLEYWTGEDCPQLLIQPLTIPIVRKGLPDAEVHCSVGFSPTLALRLDRTRLSSDTAYIRVRVSNPSHRTAVLKHVALSLPSYAGITLLDPLDTIVNVPPIPPGASIDLVWIVRLESWAFERPVALRVSVVDTFNVVVAECASRETIPGASGSICFLTVNDPVWVRSDDGSHNPSPILAKLLISNQSDTIRAYRDLQLDLSSAPFLKFESGEQARRDDFVIDINAVANFEWRLRVFPIPGNEIIQTIRVRYHVEADEVVRICEARVRIIVLKPELYCSIQCQDSLHLDGSGLTFIESSVAITAEFHNGGTLPQPLHYAELSFPAGERVDMLSDAQQVLSMLPVGEAAMASWSIRIPAYPFKRDVSMTATAYDSAGKAITSCSDFIHAPAIVLQCGITAPDSVRYDAASGNYTPERFEVKASLFNASDTALTNLRAILDSTQLQRAKLTASNFALQSRAELLSGETWDVRWELEPLYGDRDAAELFRVRFEYTPSNLYTFCERGVIIGGAPRIAAMACATAGHDTVWADSFHETLLPDPVQVQYTLCNTGNIPTPACELAILPPPMLRLEAGEDSIRSVPVLQPGDAFSAEWLLRIAVHNITPGSWPIRWVTQCADGVQPPQCEHSVFLRERAPEGVVLTPWLLRFEAEQDGPLPASRQIQVWTGGGLTPSWCVTSVPAWLDVSPLFGAGHTVMTAGPNTTALPLGEHTDRIVLSETPISTGDVQVIYSIRTPLGVDESARPGSLRIGSVYPNPASAGATLVVDYRNAAAGEITLSLHDMLGRERLAVTQRGFADGFLSVPTQGLPAGAYVLRLRAGTRVAEKLVMVLP
jgi:hypothetical protein